MRNIRFKAFVLVIILMFGCISGCSTSKNSSSSKSTKKTKNLSGSISIMIPEGPYRDYVKNNIIPSFTKQNPKVQVNISDEKNIDTAVSGLKIPDVYFANYGYDSDKYRVRGLLVKYEDFSDYKDLSKKIDNKFITKVNDNTYCIPWFVTTELMFYNKKLFVEAGLDENKPPKTLDELLECAKKISNLPARTDGSKVYGINLFKDIASNGRPNWESLFPIYYNMNNGKYKLLNNTGTDVVFDNPNARLANLYDFMSIAQNYAPANTQSNIQINNVGMWLQYGDTSRTILQGTSGASMDMTKYIGAASIPVVKEGDVSHSILDGKNILLFKSNKEKQQIAFEFVKYLMSDNINLETCKTFDELPILKSLEKNKYFQSSENKQFMTQLKNAIPVENFSIADAVGNTIEDVYINSVITKKLSAQDAVKVAAQKSRDIIKNTSK